MTGSLPASDALETLRWLLGLSLATLLARPLALRLLVGEGGGWIAGRLLGWLIVGWVPWLLAAFHILPFGAGAMAGIVVLALSALRSGLGPRDLRGWIGAELAFLALFWLGLVPEILAFPLYLYWTTSVFFMTGVTIGNLNALALEPMGHLAGTAASLVTAIATVASVAVATPVGQAFDGTPLPLVAGVFACCLLALPLLFSLPPAER